VRAARSQAASSSGSGSEGSGAGSSSSGSSGSGGSKGGEGAAAVSDEGPVVGGRGGLRTHAGLRMDTHSGLRGDREWNQFQQHKRFADQAPLASVLSPLGLNEEGASEVVDVCVVGCGPAGLALARALGEEGLSVGLVGPDAPFVNNYGIWTEEFEAMGLEGTLSRTYEDAIMHVDGKEERRLGRRYAHVGRRELRDKFLADCAGTGVRYLDALVQGVENGEAESKVAVSRGGQALGSVRARCVVFATGHNREFLQYEEGPNPGWQTAYGVEVELVNNPFDPKCAVFMDLRQSSEKADADGDTADAEGGGEDRWRVPSFLYVLPGGGNRVFLEETCLVARVQMPFEELRDRLHERMARMGLEVVENGLLEEEASWIPLGGTLPVAPQRNLAFGAAAGLVHPASGYSIVNSFSKARPFAQAVAKGLREGDAANELAPGPDAASRLAWDVLWNAETRRRMGFYQFGMELIMSLRLRDLRGFFQTFYNLPEFFWKGFLSHRLDSAQLLAFAVSVFAIAENSLRIRLLKHLVCASGAGVRLLQAYTWPLAQLLQGRGAERETASAPLKRNPRTLTSVFAAEQSNAELLGVPPGMQGAGSWWLVGGAAKAGK